MFAKRTIKRAQNRVFHIMRNADEQARPVNYFVLPDYSDPEFDHVAELNNSQRLQAEYLGRRADAAYSELCELRAMPWYRKLFLA